MNKLLSRFQYYKRYPSNVIIGGSEGRKLKNFRVFQFSLLVFFLFIQPLFLYGEEFSYSGDKMSSYYSQGRERALLTGNAKLKTSSLDIKADRIELYGKDYQFAWCSGNIDLTDNKRGIIIKGDTLYYDRDQELSRIQGNVYLEDKDNEVIIKGRFLENREKQNVLIVQLGVRIIKDDMICRSEMAIYRRSEDILELMGLPLVYKGRDWFEATRIIINLETDEMTLEGGVQGVIKQDDKSEPEAESITDSEETP